MALAPNNGTSAPWHDGERNLQAHAGVRERMEERGRVLLRDHMPQQHQQFFCAREQMFLATIDDDGQPWATMLEGHVGFITSESNRQLVFDAMIPAGDPGALGLADGAPIGALGIEFSTRRRNRVNGSIRRAAGQSGFTLDVVQCFGNCAQYIQARRPLQAVSVDTSWLGPSIVRRSAAILPGYFDLISSADTFFIASRSAQSNSTPSGGLDISHRGGRPGFVKIDGNGYLRFPDYRGNFFFNTLGNLMSDARCSLMFLDFANGTTLQVAGLGTVITDAAAIREWPGAERAVAIEIKEVVHSEKRSRLTWKFLSFARQFEQQGEQDQHRASLDQPRSS